MVDNILILAKILLNEYYINKCWKEMENLNQFSILDKKKNIFNDHAYFTSKWKFLSSAPWSLRILSKMKATVSGRN